MFWRKCHPPCLQISRGWNWNTSSLSSLALHRILSTLHMELCPTTDLQSLPNLDSENPDLTLTQLFSGVDSLFLGRTPLSQPSKRTVLASIPNGVCLVGFWNCLALVGLLFAFLSTFLNANVYNHCSTWFQHYISEADNLFLDFHELIGRRRALAQDGSCQEPHSDLV